MKSALFLAVLWSASVPKLGTVHAYKGNYGWHETLPYADNRIHLDKSEISEAFHTCAGHKWQGYVSWYSMVGHEVDSCQFLQQVIK